MLKKLLNLVHPWPKRRNPQEAKIPFLHFKIVLVPLEQLAFNEKGISPSRGCVLTSNLVPRHHALDRISPPFVGLAYQGKNIVFRFIIEYIVA
jgi:hypothetical protein